MSCFCSCGTAEVYAKGLCLRHYTQARRGRLGSTREVERGSPRESLTVTLSRAAVERLVSTTNRTGETRSQMLERLLLQATPSALSRRIK